MSISRYNLKVFFAVLGLFAFFCVSAVSRQIFSLSGAISFVQAEEIDPDAVAKRRQQLEEELAKLESQIEGYQNHYRGKTERSDHS